MIETQTDDARALLDVRNLRVHFPIRRGLWRRQVGAVRAVDDVSFTVREQETLALVGESGCGKTTTGRALLQAIKPTSGEVWFKTRAAQWVDLVQLKRKDMISLRKEMQLIFQDPFASLDPRMTVRNIIGEPLVVNGLAKGKRMNDMVRTLLEQVGMHAEAMPRYPHAFSGGQRQRISIARALALRPRLIVADEAVSALDVSVQAQILNLMERLQEQMGLAYLFIAHDLSVVQHVSDRVAVMYAGQIVELADIDTIFRQPRHPYTEGLLAAVPNPDPKRRSSRKIPHGEVSDPSHLPSGCYFHPRCYYAQEICRTEMPRLTESAPGCFARCHFADELELRGVEAE